MSCLAYAPDELTPTPKLAEITKVPVNYLAKVLQLLAQAELIKGRRGVGGGYRLSKAASDITLLDVINAIDPVERIRTCPLDIANHGGNLCPLHRSVDAAAAAVIERFGGVSLQDLVNDSSSNRPLCADDQTANLTIGGANKPSGGASPVV